ncbi:uncharacterized protein LAESUDRAFT_657435 [Laetiporus sulphureus 93-53]|uniref:SEC7 domain-containing protein n=1 Tax=Laetiporus sulphureus 93-53 TaxID=1314785 RepID=A0A165DCT8_9APHY|nr:uncharacterized protein LAESUDRAFT_657435 [Laetiporus sulphureus 93-53]KZT04583.1 hypothetical protein LAESUDRAFT_657435 [Laetiporus sulphureus 93-53]
MEPSSVAEQRATAIAKLKRAASLPRMKDGRRPPMHVEAVSEGERVEHDRGIDEESAQDSQDSDGKQAQHEEKVDQGPGTEAPKEEVKREEVGAPPPEAPAAESTPVRAKRRSRSRTRSRGSRDMKGKASTKAPSHFSSASHTNESSADENYTSAPGEDPPPSPPLISPVPIPSAFALPPSRFLASPFFYPGTSSTPLPTLDDIQHGIARMGLYRSNSAGAARAMAMSKLTGGREPVDMSFISPSPTPPPGGARLQRNNTVAGGERIAARRLMLHRLGNRINLADGDQTSGGEEVAAPTIPPKRRRRRSRRSSRASTVVDDREEREPASTAPTTPNVPSTPLPQPPPLYNPPEPPRLPSSPRATNGDAGRVSPLAKANGNAAYTYEKPTLHRGVVVEDEDDVPQHLSPRRPLPQPPTPGRGFTQLPNVRLPLAADAATSSSPTESATSATTVPVYLSRNTGLSSRDAFPASPFATPLREKQYLDEDEEQVVYQEARSRSRLAHERDRENEKSWVADSLPVRRMPVDDDEDDDIEDDVREPEPEVEGGDERPSAENSDRHSNRSYPRTSPHPPPRPDLVVELETSPEPTLANGPPSPISPIIPLTSAARDAPAGRPTSPITYPTRLSVVPSQSDRSPSNTDFPEWEDQRATLTDSTMKRAAESTSTWEKVKNTFSLSRSGSVNGRRSRANSTGIRDRRNNTDSSVSRESRTSLTKEKGDQSHEIQVPSASTSIVSLPMAASTHSGVSPATPNDLAVQYNFESNSKLFPFPGIKELEEQRNRARGLSQSTSNPDIASAGGMGTEATSSSGSSNTATRGVEANRERKLSHQASDSRLLPKFNTVTSPPPITAVSSSNSQGDQFSMHPTASDASTTGSLKLPMNREGVKKWLNAKRKLFPTHTSPVQIPGASTSPSAESRPQMGNKKPSLSDLLLGRKEMELATEWEEPSPETARTPSSAPSSATVGVNTATAEERKLTGVQVRTEVLARLDTVPEPVLPVRAEVDVLTRTNGVISPPSMLDFSNSYSSPPELLSSTTPDPQSSLEEYTNHSTSESYSASISSSHRSPELPSNEASQSVIVLERLDEILGRGSKSSPWPNTIDEPPRKLILSSPVLQVANANTVKDRFLFLFDDILVIAKPIVQDSDALLETMKPSPLDRKFIVKSVCQLRQLRLSSDRDESRGKVPVNANPTKHPVIRSFVHQFAKDPEHAITALFSKTTCSRDDHIALGQLLFRTLDLDRMRLGEYLARRSSKVVMKAYVDSFGLTGVRVDKAFRVYLQSICIPAKVGALEYLLDSFASRWYEANAGIVAYDRDLAIRIVRAIVQLNEVMHGSIADEPGMTGYPKRNIISQDFITSFRRFDPRSLVSDDLLDKIYASIRRERLSQARGPTSATDPPDIPITIKRPLPSRLTYRVQSEPIVMRIPHPDSHLTIQLFGQDLVFDPPVLNFSKSSEASFRVIGTSLGSKSIIMWRSGPNALLYSGLPFGNPLVVERAFMRNTFQVAFLNHTGMKRRYMFSVDDPLIRHQWTVSLRQQIDIASLQPSPGSASGSSAKERLAHENLAFKVLEETLIQPEEDDYPTPLSPVDQAFARLVGASSSRHGAHASISSTRALFAPPNGSGVSGNRRRGNGPHVRSKSRSQVYHRHGPGKLEHDLSDSPDFRSDDDQLQREASSQSHQQRLWSGRDLEIVCRHNSMIAPVLAYLQTDRSDHDRTNGTIS